MEVASASAQMPSQPCQPTRAPPRYEVSLTLFLFGIYLHSSSYFYHEHYSCFVQHLNASIAVTLVIRLENLT